MLELIDDDKVLTIDDIVKAMVFPVFIYECERWTIRKAECWRVVAFKLVLEKTFESPLGSKKIKPVNPQQNQP